MRLERKEKISIIYWLEARVPESVNVVDGFPNRDLTLPTVSITNLGISGKPLELGGCELSEIQWRIDIFTENKTQRDQLMYDLYEDLEANIVVYDYDEGFPPSVSPSQLGTLIVRNREAKTILEFELLIDKLYWRSEVSFTTYFQ